MKQDADYRLALEFYATTDTVKFEFPRDRNVDHNPKKNGLKLELDKPENRADKQYFTTIMGFIVFTCISRPKLLLVQYAQAWRIGQLKGYSTALPDPLTTVPTFIKDSFSINVSWLLMALL